MICDLTAAVFHFLEYEGAPLKSTELNDQRGKVRLSRRKLILISSKEIKSNWIQISPKNVDLKL